MTSVRVAPGKFVTISSELAEKAARVFATGLTRDQVRELMATEPRVAETVIIGSSKPLTLARPKTVVGKTSSSAWAACVAGLADASAGKR